MENNNQNNGRGIFYGVIGIATLVVAVIGATFAFFTATANSAENAVSATGATVQNFGFAEVKNGLRTALVPVDASNANFGRYIGIAADANETITSCEDDKGNDICSVYQFTVTNQNSFSQDAYFFLESIQNTFGHLRYAIFQGATPKASWDVDGVATDTSTSTTADDTLLVSDTAIPHQSATGFSNSIQLTSLNHTFGPNETKTYTLVLWIAEINIDQTSDLTTATYKLYGTGSDVTDTPFYGDSGRSFSAGIRISTSANGQGGVTGVLSAAG